MQQGWNPQGGAPGAPQYGQQPQQGYGAPQAPQGYGAPQAPQGQPGYGQPGMQPMGGPMYTPPIAGSPAAQKMPAFLSGMLDFSFTNFVAPKVIKVLYGIWMLAVVGFLLFGIYGAIDTMFLRYYTHIGEGLIILLLTPIMAAMLWIVGRIYMEVLIVLFRIAENLTELNKKTKDQNVAAS